MKFFLLVALVVALATPARTQQYDFGCYTSAEDPNWTLTDGMTKFGAGFIWKQGKKRIELTTGGIGTGIIARMAIEDGSGEVHTYLYVRGVLVFDMVPYEPGCSGDRTWVDKDCKRVLLSQGDAWSDRVTYYFMDADKPVTSCHMVNAPQSEPEIDLECNSGRKIRLDTSNFLTATVDGIEMRSFDGPLPCSGNFGQPGDAP